MGTQRLFGVLALLIACTAMLRANPLADRKITQTRFQGWVILQDVCTETTIDQVWRQRLYDLPRGVDGYSMVSYRVARADSSAAAENIVKDLLRPKRFSDYLSQGYRISNEAWNVNGYAGAKFIVQGMDHSMDRASVAHRADIYTFAVTAQEWFIWLEVRESVSSSDASQLDRIISRTGGEKLAEDLVGLVFDLWNTNQQMTRIPGTPLEPAVQPGNTTEAAQPSTVEAKPEAQPPATQPTAVEPKPAVQPGVEITQPTVEAQPPTTEPKPAAVPPAVEPKPVATPPATETKPEAQPPAAQPAAIQPTPEATPPVVEPKPEAQPPTSEQKPEAKPPIVEPKPIVTPAVDPKPQETPPASIPAGSKAWSTADGALTLVIPTEWTVAGTNVYTLKGLPNVSIRLLPPDRYVTPEELTRALRDFTDTQREISRKGFTQQPYTVDGASGVQVHYNAYHGHTMHLYYFGKSGLIWRLEIDLPGDDMPVPPALEQVLKLVKLK